MEMGITMIPFFVDKPTKSSHCGSVATVYIVAGQWGEVLHY